MVTTFGVGIPEIEQTVKIATMDANNNITVLNPLVYLVPEDTKILVS